MSVSYLCADSLHETHPLYLLTYNFFRFFFCVFYGSFQISLATAFAVFFLILIRLPSSLVYNGIIPDSSILYPDFIREYYSSLTLNRIMPRLIRMFIRGITYLSVRSLNLLIMKIAMENIIGSNMKRVFIGCCLEYFCSELMTRF